MANLKVSKRHIITLWHETQMGQMKKCNEAQAEFAELMWKLYDELDWKKDMQPEIFDADKDCQQYHKEQDLKAMEKNNE